MLRAILTRSTSLPLLILSLFSGSNFPAARDQSLPAKPASEITTSGASSSYGDRLLSYIRSCGVTIEGAFAKELRDRSDVATIALERLLEKYSDRCGLKFTLPDASTMLRFAFANYLDPGADPDTTGKGYRSESRRCSLLSIAISSDDLDAVTLLLKKYRADPNQSEAVEAASACPNPEIFELLLEAGLDLDNKYPDSLHDCFKRFAHNLLHHKHAHSDTAVTELLIRRGCSVHRINKDGHTPLTQLASKAIVPYLWLGAPNAKEHFELYLRSTVRILLAAGANRESVMQSNQIEGSSLCSGDGYKGMTALEIATTGKKRYAGIRSRMGLEDASDAFIKALQDSAIDTVQPTFEKQ